jgi:hypothetical protein
MLRIYGPPSAGKVSWQRLVSKRKFAGLLGVRGHVRALKLGDMSPSLKAATCRRTPNGPRWSGDFWVFFAGKKPAKRLEPIACEHDPLELLWVRFVIFLIQGRAESSSANAI